MKVQEEHWDLQSNISEKPNSNLAAGAVVESQEGHLNIEAEAADLCAWLVVQPKTTAEHLQGC